RQDTLQGDGSVADGLHVVAARGQIGRDELADAGIIVNEHDPALHACRSMAQYGRSSSSVASSGPRSGSAKWMRVLPVSLSAQMRPPWDSTRPRQMASPSPVPGI